MGSFIYVADCKPRVTNLVFANTNGTITQMQNDRHAAAIRQVKAILSWYTPQVSSSTRSSAMKLIGMTINSDGTLGNPISPFSGFPLTPTPGVNVAIGLDPGGNFLFASQSRLTGANLCPYDAGGHGICGRCGYR